MFTWAFSSRYKEIETRRDFIFEKTQKMFPNANLLVLVKPKDKDSPWAIRRHKGFAHFEGYGDSDVIICLF